MFKGFISKDGKQTYIKTDSIIAIYDNMKIHKQDGLVEYISNIYLSGGQNINVIGKASDLLEYIEE